MRLAPRRLARRAAATARAAFSLAEVLVVLLIVGFLMLAITQLLEATRISRDTIHNVQETQLAGPAIMELIARDLRGMVTYGRRPEELLQVRDRVVYGSDADSIDFATTTNSLVLVEVARRLVRSDMNEVGYHLRPNPDEDDFLEIYRREDFGIDDEPFEGGTYTFLHDRVKQFDIQVFDEDGFDADPLDEWSSGDMGDEELPLPRRLEISMTLELAPRINREQLQYASVDKRTVTYRRVIRLDQNLLASLEVDPVPLIPEILDPEEQAEQQQQGGGGGPRTPPEGNGATTPEGGGGVPPSLSSAGGAPGG